MNLVLLKEIRKSKKVTQEDMAKHLGYSGKSSYNMLENGNVGISIEISKKIRDILNLSDEQYNKIFLT